MGLKTRRCRTSSVMDLSFIKMSLSPVSMQVMRVKLQPPSGTSLNAFNPIQPPSTISQIMLLANPSKVCAVSYRLLVL